ncbi:MAG: TatD family hydrolase [Synergistaceae bacterium]|nr:TatD family hydrolase [Synergistaceae bacterium]
MILIDSHCHINSQELRLDTRAVISRAREAGVKKFMNVGCDYEDSCEAVAMAHDFAQFGLYASIGIHPHESGRYERVPEEFYSLIKSERVLAVGEIGLDYHYNHSSKEEQHKMFISQLEFAASEKMPVILHIREAMNDAMKILRDYRDLKLLFHCYSGGFEFLDEVLSMDSLLAFGGALTWTGKNSDNLREVFKRVPIQNILLETDCPYMAPVPFRGKINEPSYIKYVYDKAAEIKNLNISDLANKIEINAKNFFNWE